MRVPDSSVSRATDEEILGLLQACRSARDRLLVLLMALAGLRRSEAVGLRREDVHFVVDASMLGCATKGAHLHVTRRDNPNRAWAKSRRSRTVPAHLLLVQAFDQYSVERGHCALAGDSDFVLVNLFRPPFGVAMPPGAVNELLVRLCHRAHLKRNVSPHMLRHAFGSSIMDSGGSLDEVQHLLGHASITSSQVYLHPAPQRLRNAVERVGSLSERATP
jgi:site-specific recombinase XerD